MNFRHVYVDGDYFLYKCSFGTQRNIYHVYVDGQLAYVSSSKKEINRIFKGIDYHFERYLYVQPPYAAVQLWKNTMQRFKDKFNPRHFTVALTGPDNFRDQEASILPYKGTRDSEKPVN